MKKSIQVLLAVVAALSLANCTTETRVIEVTRYVPSKPSAPKKKTPGPSEFKVVNSYDNQRL
jgi:hypothetical protein